MEQNCTVKIESRIESDDEIEVISSDESGLFLSRNGSWFITYFQDGVPTRIILTRDGTANVFRGKGDNKLILIPNEYTNCSYNTDYFPIELKIHTTKVEHNLSEKGGIVRLHYSIIHSEDEVQKFKLKLIIAEA